MMTPAEFATKAGNLGLSSRWIAKQLNVKLSMVHAWQKGFYNNQACWPPQGAVELLEKVETFFDEQTIRIAGSVEPEVSECVFVRFISNEDLASNIPDMGWLGAQAHAQLTWRIKEFLERTNPKMVVHIINFIPQVYAKWLQETGQTDSLQTRSEWRLTQTRKPNITT